MTGNVLEAFDIDEVMKCSYDRQYHYNFRSTTSSTLKKSGKIVAPPKNKKKPKIQTDNILPQNIADKSYTHESKNQVSVSSKGQVKKKISEDIKPQEVQKKEQIKMLKTQKTSIGQVETRQPPPLPTPSTLPRAPQSKPRPIEVAKLSDASKSIEVRKATEVPEPHYEPIEKPMGPPQAEKQDRLKMQHSNSERPILADCRPTVQKPRSMVIQKQSYSQNKGYSDIFSQRFDKRMEEYEDVLSSEKSAKEGSRVSASVEQQLKRQNAVLKEEISSMKSQLSQLIQLISKQQK